VLNEYLYPPALIAKFVESSGLALPDVFTVTSLRPYAKLSVPNVRFLWHRSPTYRARLPCFPLMPKTNRLLPTTGRYDYIDAE
jgi:hypothetical protein